MKLFLTRASIKRPNNMKQLISLYIAIGKRLFSTTNICTPTALDTVQTKTSDSSKPDGWNDAKPYHSIPGPKELPFLGNTWRFFPIIGNLYRHNYNDINKLFHKKYGEISRLGGLPFPDMVMIYAPKDFEHLFRNEGIYPERESTSKSFTYYRRNVRKDLFQDYTGIGGIHGKEWHKIRSKLNPIVMHPQSVLQYVGGMDTIANQLVQKIRYAANSDPQREMPDNFNLYLYAWTLESILLVSLDNPLGCLNINLSHGSEASKLVDAVIEVFELFFIIETDPTVRNIYKTKTWKRFVELMDFITFTFFKYMDIALAKLEEDKDKPTRKETTMLQQLLKIDKRMGVTAALDFVLGGVSTTAKVAGSALYFLSKTPKAQNTLREELFKLLPNKDSPLTKEALSKASYLKAVIKETTRLSPITTGTTRRTVKDMVICGYQIPKGTNVFASNLVLSTSEEHYIRANEFIPERWLRTTTGDLSSLKPTSPFITLPFGVGPRACIGRRLANLELEIGIAKILRNFYLEWHHKDVTFKATPFYGINEPLKLRVYEVEQ